MLLSTSSSRLKVNNLDHQKALPEFLDAFCKQYSVKL